jgi:prepilin-type N-terminal cleavage/methylation domain-containing protein
VIDGSHRLNVGRSRRGFTLAEIVVSAVILTIIAAVAVPSFSGYYSQKRATDTAGTLNSLALSLNNYNNQVGPLGYLQTVLKYPQRLNHLTNKISTTDKQCSGAAYTGTMVTAWLTRGPYSGLNIVSGMGVATPLGWVHDSVIKGTQTGTFGSSQSGWVELHIDSLSDTDVQNLDVLVDNAIDSTTGLIRDSTATATLTSAHLHLVRFLLPAPLNGANSIGCF